MSVTEFVSLYLDSIYISSPKEYHDIDFVCLRAEADQTVFETNRSEMRIPMSTSSFSQEGLLLAEAEKKRLMTFEKRYRDAAKRKFTARCAYYHTVTGGNYTSITVRDQKTRWGSCSSRGTLSFNYRLIFAPTPVLDYVVVHELCHLTHMNHSKAFWNMVERIMPDYQIYKNWLREHGHELTLENHLRRQGIALRLW